MNCKHAGDCRGFTPVESELRQCLNATYTDPDTGVVETAQWARHGDIPAGAVFVGIEDGGDQWAYQGMIYRMYGSDGFAFRILPSTERGISFHSRAARLRLPGFEEFDEPVLEDGEEWVATHRENRELSTEWLKGTWNPLCIVGYKTMWTGADSNLCHIRVTRHCTRHYAPGMVIRVVAPPPSCPFEIGDWVTGKMSSGWVAFRVYETRFNDGHWEWRESVDGEWGRCSDYRVVAHNKVVR
jgi:hypothetical protein